MVTCSHNYPGGHAFSLLHQLKDGNSRPGGQVWQVHIDTLSAMTGVSRFGEHPDGWQYSKVTQQGTPVLAVHVLLEL